MAFILFGLGGSWLAVFGTIAGLSLPVLSISVLLIILGWAAAAVRGTIRRQKWLLASATALTVLAWIVYLNEAAINLQLIEMM